MSAAFSTNYQLSNTEKVEKKKERILKLLIKSTQEKNKIFRSH